MVRVTDKENDKTFNIDNVLLLKYSDGKIVKILKQNSYGGKFVGKKVKIDYSGEGYRGDIMAGYVIGENCRIEISMDDDEWSVELWTCKKEWKRV